MMRRRIPQQKGQMEIMGLLMIVILLILGILFVLQNIIGKQSTPARENYERSQLVANYINAMLRTSTDGCDDRTINDLYIDCAQTASITCEDGRQACIFLNNTVIYLFNQTFDVWKQEYEFMARVGTGPTAKILTHIRKGCTDFKTGDVRKKETYPLPLNDGRIMMLEMTLC